MQLRCRTVPLHGNANLFQHELRRAAADRGRHAVVRERAVRPGKLRCPLSNLRVEKAWTVSKESDCNKLAQIEVGAVEPSAKSINSTIKNT